MADTEWTKFKNELRCHLFEKTSFDIFKEDCLVGGAGELLNLWKNGGDPEIVAGNIAYNLDKATRP